MTDPKPETTVQAAAEKETTTATATTAADVATAGVPTAKATTDGAGENAQGQDEDFSKEYEPVVRLAEVVKTKTGEEDEEVLFKIRAKLFRFNKELNEWKERGTGDIRVLQHRENQKIRLLMRREKTLKICLNHYVNPDVELIENVGSDRSWMWHGVDYADGERDEALLAIRFRDSDSAQSFKDAYVSACEEMRKLKGGDSKANDKASEKDGANGKDTKAGEKATGAAGKQFVPAS